MKYIFNLILTLIILAAFFLLYRKSLDQLETWPRKIEKRPLNFIIAQPNNSRSLPLNSYENEDSLQNFTIVFFLPTRSALRKSLDLIGQIKSNQNNAQIRILLYADIYRKYPRLKWETELVEILQFSIAFDVLSSPLSFETGGTSVISDWIANLIVQVDIIISLKEVDLLVNFLKYPPKDSLLSTATVIQIPISDLEHAYWMSSLTLEEWKAWHQPNIDISIITKDRPSSLKRLLVSLGNSLYFGDHLNLRVNVEQDCDSESLKIVENISWPFGHVFIHHRIIHGGLLPAIVESWYPKDNNSYGVLLEDDIELSPLFYAWIKMTLLRYRHGHTSNRLPNMYGVSLYQQKHLELPLIGRKKFNPRLLFAEAGLSDPVTPYLSQVPCSWGALYFPEQWREFHHYLVLRLAEIAFGLENDVVPNVRSNQWSKSWKKFFIELVYFRGYVMLYPNYEDFLSLSTNHLEIGSHVKFRLGEQKDIFLLPLMELGGNATLLDLPRRSLPYVASLPILNLTGSLISHKELFEEGLNRRANLLDCDNPEELYNIHSFMCIKK